MYNVSDEYREEMKDVLRGHTSVNVYMSLVNNDAQKSAHITSSFSGDEDDIYDSAYITENAYFEYSTTVIPSTQASFSGSVTTLKYASFSDSTTSIHSNTGSGVTSTENDGSITFTFDGSENNIAGLTIEFNTKPNSITVTNGDTTVTCTVNELTFMLDHGFRNSSYIKITPNSGKLSIKSIIFGIKLQFHDRQLFNTSRHNLIDHISNELPIKNFTFTVDNRTHMFNLDNPLGYADYIQEKQEVTWDYGHDMPDGSVYFIAGGKVLLNTWSSDDFSATFNCVGRINYMTGTYYKGKYYEGGISAYDLAEQVFFEAGEEDYYLDDCLKNVTIHNPIPVCEFRQALQYIANACKCILFEDRNGFICIMNANMPSFIYTVYFKNATPYSTGSTLFSDNSAYNYADAEDSYADASGTMMFLPQESSYANIGYVSSELADANGNFESTPVVSIKFKSAYDMTSFGLHFTKVKPTKLTYRIMLENEVVSSGTLIDGQISLNTTIEYDGKIDAIILEFPKASPNQRIHLNHLSLNGFVGYELTKRDLKYTPNATSLDKVSKINVHTYTFAKESTSEGSSHSEHVSIVSTPNDDNGDTVDVFVEQDEYGSSVASVEAVVGNNLIILDSPYYNYMVTEGEIIESGAYYLVVSSSAPQHIDVFANPYSVTDNIFTLNVHEKGVEKDLRNQLVGTQIHARQLAQFLKEHYDDDLEYNLTYRGDPVLDADDMIYVANDFVSLNEVRITEETLNTSMGLDFSCTIRARRNSYVI